LKNVSPTPLLFEYKTNKSHYSLSFAVQKGKQKIEENFLLINKFRYLFGSFVILELRVMVKIKQDEMSRRRILFFSNNKEKRKQTKAGKGIMSLN